MTKNLTLNRLLVYFVAAGFFFLMIDTMIEHLSIFGQDPLAFIPVVFSAAGLVVAIATAVRWSERWLQLLHYTLYATFLVAAAGLAIHIGDRFEEREQVSEEKRLHEQREVTPPLLAPGAFAGLAVVGLLGTSRKWGAEVINQQKPA